MFDVWTFFCGLWVGMGLTIALLTWFTMRMERTHDWVKKSEFTTNSEESE